MDILYVWILAPFWLGLGRGLEVLGASQALSWLHFFEVIFGMLSISRDLERSRKGFEGQFESMLVIYMFVFEF